ncbi:MAG TPA: hypothetical protein DG048_20785 [Pseudoalteromonas sp.]|nr:hypothetical protein [Pseudoalteromonas sp.]|tara:strand:+ start:692 stop:1339 length:648 start_codon:yes stop_codon:yes gene_type:complete
MSLKNEKANKGFYEPANLQTLGTHKGNLLRLGLHFSSGDKYYIEPLSIGAAGIVLKSYGLDSILQMALTPRGYALLGPDSSIIGEFEPPGELIRIESLVLYPSGRVWEGSLDDEIKTSSALIWNWDLAWHLDLPDHQIRFGMGNHWRDVPTLIGINTELTDNISTAPACTRIEHSCPRQCDERSKFIPDPDNIGYPRREYSIPGYRRFSKHNNGD